MANPIMRSSFPSDLLPIINEWHGDDLKLQEDLVSKIMEIESSDGAYEVDGVLIPMSTMQKKGEGQTLMFDTSRQFYTPRFTHDTWALGFKISMEMMQDGKTMKEARRFTRMLAEAEAETRNILAANVLNNGAVSSVLQDGGDGVCLFSASHPQGQGPVQSNVIATNAALSEASLEALTTQIRLALDLRGKRANINPDKLIINTTLLPQARRILDSDLRVGTTNNDMNYLKDAGVFKEVVATPYLSSTTAFIVKTTVNSGLRFYDRFSSGIESDNEFDTKNMAFSKAMRVSAGWVNYLGAFNAAGA
jgi:hypothetical protein